jgi:hypothetical protein
MFGEERTCVARRGSRCEPAGHVGGSKPDCVLTREDKRVFPKSGFVLFVIFVVNAFRQANFEVRTSKFELLPPGQKKTGGRKSLPPGRV